MSGFMLFEVIREQTAQQAKGQSADTTDSLSVCRRMNHEDVHPTLYVRMLCFEY